MLSQDQRDALDFAKEMFTHYGDVMPPPQGALIRIPTEVIYHLYGACLTMQEAYRQLQVVPRPPAPVAAPSPKKSARVTRPRRPTAAQPVSPVLRPAPSDDFQMLPIDAELAMRFASAYVAFERGEIHYAALEAVKQEMMKSLQQDQVA
jgi:hypothetical protein